MKSAHDNCLRQIFLADGPVLLALTEALQCKCAIIQGPQPLFEIFNQFIDSFYDYSNGILRTSWGHLRDILGTSWVNFDDPDDPDDPDDIDDPDNPDDPADLDVPDDPHVPDVL